MTGFEAATLRAQHADLGLEVAALEGGELRLEIGSARALELLQRLRDRSPDGSLQLFDLTAIDRGVERTPRFELVYRLRVPAAEAAQADLALRLHALVEPRGEDPEVETPACVDSVIGLWPVARWLEREVFDLFGIDFRGHSELRRLLLPSDFVGAPLRKDFAS